MVMSDKITLKRWARPVFVRPFKEGASPFLHCNKWKIKIIKPHVIMVVMCTKIEVRPN